MSADWSEGGESRAAKQSSQRTGGLAAERMPRSDWCHIRGRSRLLFFWLHEHSPHLLQFSKQKGKSPDISFRIKEKEY